MPTIVGVRIGPAGKVLSFDAAGTNPELGDVVVVSTERGEEIGEVAAAPQEIEEEQVERKLKPVLRIATDRDRQIAEELADREVNAMRRFRELITEHKLDMKPVAVEALFDERKIVFFFTAEERVDFRELVKDLARDFKARIDMRQIGVRDEARMLGGIGHCGEQLCCRRYMTDFEPVSIRMAKAQDLPLNPLKISGLCGRLMCCLRYEYDAYKDFKSRAPKVGAAIETPTGGAKVIGLDAPREKVTLIMEGGRVTVPLSGMECGGCQSGRPCRVTAEALAEAQAGKSTLELSSLESSGSSTPAKDGRSKRQRGDSSSLRDSVPASGSETKEGEGSDKGGGRSSRQGSRRRGKGSRGGSSKSKQGDKSGAKQGSGQQGGGSGSGGGKSGSGRQGGGKQGQARSSQGSQASQGAKDAPTSGSGSGRRRRRRRPRSDSGGESKTES